MQLTKTEYEELAAARENAEKARKQAVQARDKLDALLADAVITDEPPAGETPTWTTQDGAIYWQGQPFNMVALNWGGGEDVYGFNGIWGPNTLTDIANAATDAGFNAIRLLGGAVLSVAPDFKPFVQAGSWWPKAMPSSANSQYASMTAIQVLDEMVAQLTAAQMPFLLDPCHTFCNDPPAPYAWNQWDSANIGLAANFQAPQWLDMMEMLALRYAGNPYFIGLESDNEPWGDVRFMPTSEQAYKVGSTCNWTKCQSDLYARLTAANPNILVGITAVEQGNSDGNAGPGECFEQWTKDPSTRPAFGPQALYVVHHYGPGIGSTKPYCNAPDFPANLPAVCDQMWGFLRAEGKTVLVSEWGMPSTSTALSDTHDTAFMDYLIDRDLNLAFWSGSNSADTKVVFPGDLTGPLIADAAVLQRIAPVLAAP